MTNGQKVIWTKGRHKGLKSRIIHVGELQVLLENIGQYKAGTSRPVFTVSKKYLETCARVA